MNTTSILKLLALLDANAKQITLCNLMKQKHNITVEKETLMGLAQPLSALVESTADQMIVT